MAVSRQRYFIPSNGTFYLDLWRSTSLQERKLHRQKNICTIYGGLYKDVSGSTIELNTAPHTWVTKRAINRVFAIWRKQAAITLQNGGQPGRWNDFKVALTRGHANNFNTVGAGGILLPVDAADQNLYTGGTPPEWEISTMTTDDPAENAGGNTASQDQWHNFIVGPHETDAPVGPNTQYIGVGMIQSWVDSRPDPTDDVEGQPASGTQVSDPYINFFDSGDANDDRMAELNDEGDQPPYQASSVFGNANGNAGAQFNLQRQSVAETTSSNAVVSVMGFQAICGLVEIIVSGDPGPGGAELILDVETKGVKF